MLCDQVAEHQIASPLLHTHELDEGQTEFHGMERLSKKPESAGESTFYFNQAFLDDSHEGIYGLDAKGFVTFVNAAAQRLTGWSAEELKGKTQHEMVHHHHADGTEYPRDECPIYQALRDGRSHHRDDEVFWRKDGTCFPVSYTSTPVVRHGRLCGAMIVFCDATDHVRQRAWQRSKTRVYLSIWNRHPLPNTIQRVVYALRVLLGTCGARCCNRLIRHPT